jgi:hypothetical protein
MFVLKLGVFVSAVTASYIIPERARGGKAWKLHGLTTTAGTPQYWDAKIDHFDGSNATYRQRYYVNAQYWDGVGPVFLQIGNIVQFPVSYFSNNIIICV